LIDDENFEEVADKYVEIFPNSLKWSELLL